VQVQQSAISQSSGYGGATNSAPNASLDTGVSSMSYAVEIYQSGNRLREWFEAVKNAATKRRMQHGTYVRILHELQSSSDYDLADLGISRLSIKDIAHKAAYGDPS
jgi:uncharacterized protein YjiS (DUF1127 family)